MKIIDGNLFQGEVAIKTNLKLESRRHLSKKSGIIAITKILLLVLVPTVIHVEIGKYTN